MSVTDRAVATSGDYQQPFTADLRQHHILDPRTGYSAPELTSATITAPTAALADAVATAVMGFDPMAQRGTYPFDRADNTLELAEARGLGTRDLSRIEVTGADIRDVKLDFQAIGKAAQKR